jgi:ATP-dependent DNA ligase
VVTDGTDLRSLPLGDRRKRLQAILPAIPGLDPGTPIISEALSVTGRGRELFDLMCWNDLVGIVAKRLGDPYEPRVRWHKIKNSGYSQKEGRAGLFNGKGHGNAQRFRQAGGELLHGSADDARQRSCRARAAHHTARCRARE